MFWEIYTLSDCQEIHCFCKSPVLIILFTNLILWHIPFKYSCVTSRHILIISLDLNIYALFFLYNKTNQMH
jgi:hypothetical protein